MADIFERFYEQVLNNIPCVLYAKPGNNSITGVFQTTPEVFTDAELSGSGFVFAPFATGETVIIPYDKAEVVVTDITPEMTETTGSAEYPEIDAAVKANFENLVSRCVTAIKKGHFEKLVASRTETAVMANSTVTTYKKLLGAYPNAFRYLFFSPLSGVWMGATPEQLLKAGNSTLHTVALAGTQLYDAEETAIWPEKEQQEQAFVTDYIMRQLRPFSAGIHTTEPYTFRAGGIVHIKTDISAQLKESVSLAGVIKTLHPTPAVCGLPKQEAKEWLLQNEGYDREYYSGFLGELNHDFATGEPKTDLFVNLRCMKVPNYNVQLFIGCGVTKDSDPEKEFYETVNKSMTMRKAL